MNSDFKNKLHLKSQNIYILYNDTGYSEYSLVKGVREVRVLFANDSFYMLVDERFNELSFSYDKKNQPILLEESVCQLISIQSYLTDKYNELKSTDFRYMSGGYESSKILYLQDFINFLKSEDRETIINNILC